jgi:hypothetical protein
MTLPSENNPISLGKIQTEFGGSDPISVTEYYRSGSYVSGKYNENIPTSGALSLSNFYGKTKAVYGCTDRNANNFVPGATDDNGTCTYPSPPPDTGPPPDDGGGGGTTYRVIGVTRYFRDAPPADERNYGDHYCTSEIGNPAPILYHQEGTFCSVFKEQAPGTSAISEDFDGNDSGVIGYAYLSDPQNGQTKAIYQLICSVKNDKLWSTSNSEGAARDGYVLDGVRFYAPNGDITV